MTILGRSYNFLTIFFNGKILLSCISVCVIVVPLWATLILSQCMDEYVLQRMRKHISCSKPFPSCYNHIGKILSSDYCACYRAAMACQLPCNESNLTRDGFTTTTSICECLVCSSEMTPKKWIYFISNNLQPQAFLSVSLMCLHQRINCVPFAFNITRHQITKKT